MGECVRHPGMLGPPRAEVHLASEDVSYRVGGKLVRSPMDICSALARSSSGYIHTTYWPLSFALNFECNRQDQKNYVELSGKFFTRMFKALAKERGNVSFKVTCR